MRRSVRRHATLQATVKVDEAVTAAARARAETALQADVPAGALKGLMSELFHAADADSSGVLSRA